MLRIRFTRTGKKGQPSFRIVVAEKAKAVKRKYLELLGHYLPATQPKKIELNKERIEYWISQGAQPTDSVAALLKSQGMSGMEQFMEPRDKKKKKKGEQAEGGDTPAKEAAPAEASDAPKDEPKEKAPAPKEEKKPAAEETPKDEPKEAAPAAEEKPAEAEESAEGSVKESAEAEPKAEAKEEEAKAA